MSDSFRLMSKSTPNANVHQVRPPSYNCQAPGCGKQSDTIACSRHLSMLPLHVQSALTNALATGEGGSYGSAMREAMNVWTTEPD